MAKQKETKEEPQPLAASEDFPSNDFMILADFFAAKKSHTTKEYALAAMNVGRWLVLSFLPDGTGPIKGLAAESLTDEMDDQSKKEFLEGCCDSAATVRGAFDWGLALSLVLEVLRKLLVR